MPTIVKLFGSNRPKAKVAKRGLGDRVERLFHPVAMALKLPCVDRAKEELRPESPCAKRRDWLNEQGKKVGIGS